MSLNKTKDCSKVKIYYSTGDDTWTQPAAHMPDTQPYSLTWNTSISHPLGLELSLGFTLSLGLEESCGAMPTSCEFFALDVEVLACRPCLVLNICSFSGGGSFLLCRVRRHLWVSLQ